MTDGGTRLHVRIKPGIYFTPDPAFKGKRRELVAAGLRLPLQAPLRPEGESQWLFLVEGKIKGADALVAEARSAPAVRLRPAHRGPAGAVDRYTLRIELNEPDYNLLYVLAMPATAAVAREVVEHYGDDFPRAPGRHRALTCSGSGCAARASCSRRIPTSARSTSRATGGDDARSTRDRRAPEGQAPAARRAASRST